MLEDRPVLARSNLVVDVACLLFAGWTVTCHAVVLLGGNTRHLLTAAVAVLLSGAVALGLILAREGGRSIAAFFDDGSGLTERGFSRSPDDHLAPGVRAAAITAALGIVIAYHFTGKYLLLWGCCSAYFVFTCWSVARAPAGFSSPRPTLTGEVVLWLSAFAGMAITLGSRRYDIDDSFYVNLAVGVADFPSRPLLRFDSIHGLGLPIQAAYYRVHTFEALAGLISYASGWDAIRVIHFFLAGAAGFLTPLALARLLRMLDSRRWLLAVLVVMVLYTLDLQPHRSYSGFAFVRLFQGKAIFLTLAVPLIAAYGIRFGAAPTFRNALFLAAAQTAGLGLTSSAIWIAPLVGMAGVASALRPRLGDLKTLAFGALSSFYLIAVGILLFLEIKGGSAHALELGIGSDASWKLPAAAFDTVVGKGARFTALIALVLLSWPSCGTILARRYVAVFGLVFFLILINPLFSQSIRSYLTGITYWRVFWVLPIPVMVALCFTFLISAPFTTGRGKLEVALTAVMLAAFFTILPPKMARVGRPALKVPSEYAVAEALTRSMEPHSYALAPRNVSLYLPTFNRGVYPILAKNSYLNTSSEDRRNRSRLSSYVSAPWKGLNRKWLTASLNRYRISGVVFSADTRRRRTRKGAEYLREALTEMGFADAGRVSKYEIWVRKTGKKLRGKP